MNGMTSFWGGLSGGQKWVVVLCGGAVVVMTGGAFAYVMVSGPVLLTLGTTTIAIGESAIATTAITATATAARLAAA